MDLQLEGKRALVTGSTTGIGEGIVKILAQEGAFVVIRSFKIQKKEKGYKSLNLFMGFLILNFE